MSVNPSYLIEDLGRQFQEKNSEQILVALENCISHPTFFQSNAILPKYEEIRLKLRISDEILDNFIEFSCLYIRWAVERKQSTDLEAFSYFILASNAFRNTFEKMQQQHEPLLKLVQGFFKICKRVTKLALEQTKQADKILKQIDNQFNQYSSVVNRSIKQFGCEYKKKILLQTYNVLLAFNFYRYNFPGCQSQLIMTKDYQNVQSQQLKVQPKSQQITFMYYYGRLLIFQQNYSKAVEVLYFSFNLCRADDFKQKRQILKYLIPAKMLCAQFATSELMQHYKLQEYNGLTEAVIQGNLHQYEQEREKWKKLWIKRSLFLVLGNLQTIVIRNLFKRIIHCLGDKYNSKVSIEFLKKGFQFSAQREFCNEEIACIIGNQFYIGYLKGYVYEGHTVVLSKTSPVVKFQKYSIKYEDE